MSAASFVVLSDLHLGYDQSLLNEPVAQDHLIDEIASLCSGQTDRLILNGDCFESCVPRDTGHHDGYGFPPLMASVARSFFGRFTKKINCTSLVIVWGNHDFTMWKRLAESCGVSTFTNNLKGDVLLQHDGQVLPGAEGFLNDVIGVPAASFSRIRSAYPNYILGKYWPYVVFHHGHFLDDLVIGKENEALYLGLKLLTGAGRPNIVVGGDEDVSSISSKTDAFVSALWKYNSHARADEWAMLRRSQKPNPCPSYPISEIYPASSVVDPTERQSPGLGKNIPWYVSLLMSDPTTPGALGSPSFPSYLFVGHDHRGGSDSLVSFDKYPWKIVNTGGWTEDGGCKYNHGHVVVWPKGANEPTVRCVKL